MDSNATVTVETIEEQPEAVQESQPVEETAAEPVLEAQPAAPIEDRSAFNCINCRGEGLLSQTELCPICNGTGKVN
ncbi:MAG TPA: hypothetical protein VF941_11730 [Clostridia bacterium]